MPHLHRRMMYFCDLTYSKSKVADRNRGAWTGRDTAIGLVGQPQRVERKMLVSRKTGELFPRDVAVIGRTDSEIIIAFRGTQPPVAGAKVAEMRSIIEDWMNDANVLGRAGANDFSGVVHDGFAEAALLLLGGDDGVVARVNALRKVAGAPQRIVLTGHSKGGAIAVLAADWMLRKSDFATSDMEIVTFGSARCGDAGFSQAFQQAGFAATRYESDADIVPLLPPGGGVSPIITQAAKMLGYKRADGATGFLSSGTRFPATAPRVAAWAAAYAPLVGQFLVNRKPLLEKLVHSHGIRANEAYDAIVPQ
jgi:hypothetical protein